MRHRCRTVTRGLTVGWGLLGPTALILVLSGLPPAAASSPGQVSGQGSGIYLHPPFTGDRVAITMETPAGTSGTGRFDVIHFDKLGDVFAHLTGAVTCVSVSGNRAFTTGTITSGHAPDAVGDVVGKAFAITLVDHGAKDLAGVSYPLDEIPPCTLWPLNMMIDDGGYTVRSGT